MIQEKPQSGELRIRASRTRKLAYTPEFKKELGLSSGAIREFLNLKNKLNRPGEKLIEKNFDAEFVQEDAGVKYYKFSVGGNPYFIKETPRDMDFTGGGPLEVRSMQKAKEMLEKRKITWAKVVDFQFGYEDSFSRYFVSRWDDRFQRTLGDYLLELEKAVSRSKNAQQQIELQKERDEVRDKTQKLEKYLGRIFKELTDNNMSYDPVTKTIYIFDLQFIDLSNIKWSNTTHKK